MKKQLQRVKQWKAPGPDGTDLRKLEYVRKDSKTSYNYCLVLSPPPEMKILSVLVKISWKTYWTFPIVCYFTQKLEFISNILSMIVEMNKTPALFKINRTVLKKKNKEKGNDFTNFRPITWLPLTWKKITKILSDKLY